MRFEAGERVRTGASVEAVRSFTEERFRRVSEKVSTDGPKIIAQSIEATFGSINRSDKTVITVTPTRDGYIVTSETNYRPSVAFWIILLITLFSYVGWIIPIGFYLYQRGTVKSAIQSVMDRVKNEFESPMSVTGPVVTATSPRSKVEELTALAALHDKGLLTDSEFEREKAKVLRD